MGPKPKPDIHAPVSAADTSNASQAIVQFLNAAKVDACVTLKILFEWVEEDHARRVRREKIVEHIPRLPGEDRALVLESVYYWWFGVSVDKEDLREFTGAFREIRGVYWKGNLGSVEAVDKEQGEKERHGCVTALQKPRQDIHLYRLL